jgi:plastocyanin
MFTRLRFLLVLLGLSPAIMLGCSSSGPSPTSPSSPASVSTANNGATPAAMAAATNAVSAAGGKNQRTIALMDACDPETFNARFGDGTCVRSGGVRLDFFLAELERKHSAGAWHFAPGQATLDVGDELVAKNNGGETHTFTEVDEFGGGIVPLLNDLTGETTVAKECNALQPKDFIPAGGTSREVEKDEGIEKYQCCIHPWMRAVVHVGKH